MWYFYYKEVVDVNNFKNIDNDVIYIVLLCIMYNLYISRKSGK